VRLAWTEFITRADHGELNILPSPPRSRFKCCAKDPSERDVREEFKRKVIRRMNDIMWVIQQNTGETINLEDKRTRLRDLLEDVRAEDTVGKVLIPPEVWSEFTNKLPTRSNRGNFDDLLEGWLWFYHVYDLRNVQDHLYPLFSKLEGKAMGAQEEYLLLLISSTELKIRYDLARDTPDSDSGTGSQTVSRRSQTESSRRTETDESQTSNAGDNEGILARVGRWMGFL